MLIRRYQAQDNEAIKALHYAGLAQFGATEDPYLDSDLDDIEGVYINNNGEFLVGIHEDELIAMGALRKVSATRGEIRRLRVRTDYQRQGYGQSILLKLLDVAAELGYTELILDTVANNTLAQQLFKKFSFVETHRGKVGIYDLVFYGKKLKQA